MRSTLLVVFGKLFQCSYWLCLGSFFSVLIIIFPFEEEGFLLCYLNWSFVEVNFCKRSCVDIRTSEILDNHCEASLLHMYHYYQKWSDFSSSFHQSHLMGTQTLMKDTHNNYKQTLTIFLRRMLADLSLEHIKHITKKFSY